MYVGELDAEGDIVACRTVYRGFFENKLVFFRGISVNAFFGTERELVSVSRAGLPYFGEAWGEIPVVYGISAVIGRFCKEQVSSVDIRGDYLRIHEGNGDIALVVYAAVQPFAVKTL